MSFLLDDDRPQRKTREECLAEMPAELQTRMADTLRSPELLRWIAAGIGQMGVGGEHSLALNIYLTGTSRLLDSPLAVIVQGPSASGKSYVIEKLAGLFPAEVVLMATDITPNALYYLAAGELEHRFVVAGGRAVTGSERRHRTGNQGAAGNDLVGLVEKAADDRRPGRAEGGPGGTTGTDCVRGIDHRARSLRRGCQPLSGAAAGRASRTDAAHPGRQRPTIDGA